MMVLFDQNYCILILIQSISNCLSVTRRLWDDLDDWRCVWMLAPVYVMSVAQKRYAFYQSIDSAVNLLASICCILIYTIIVFHYLLIIRQIKQDWCAVLTSLYKQTTANKKSRVCTIWFGREMGGRKCQ